MVDGLVQEVWVLAPIVCFGVWRRELSKWEEIQYRKITERVVKEHFLLFHNSVGGKRGSPNKVYQQCVV